MAPRWLTLLALVLLVPGAARANGFSTFGPHFGFSADPGQLVVGGHLQMGGVAPELDFVPGVDLGIGDGVTVLSLNGDFHYHIEVAGSRWQPYAGAGVSLHAYSGDGTGTVAGGSLIVGADAPTSSGSRFRVEAKFGLVNGPTFKALAGWSFPLR